MDSPTKDIFNVLDEFIAAVEETKQVLQSPCVPGRTDSCCLCECAPRRRRKLNVLAQGPCECELLQSRLMGSESELDRYDNKYDATVFINQHTSREKEAEGLVTEMNSLLNQISTAANSLKKMYRRRSAPLLHEIWRQSLCCADHVWKCSLRLVVCFMTEVQSLSVDRCGHVTITWESSVRGGWEWTIIYVCCCFLCLSF